jgi:hypothetical protein
MSEAPKSGRRMLLILAALFFVPLAASFTLYYGVGWRPAGGSNHGELLQPVRQMPEGPASLLGKWALVYVGDGRCDAACQQALVFARQTRLSLNKEMSRVNRAFLATANCCDLEYIDKEHEGLKVFDIGDPQAVSEMLALLPPGDHSHSLFIVDPNGNIVMRYDVRESPRGLLEDMKKLLKLSHIG